MRISIHQPAYLPWLGYIDRIAQSDTFVFLDTVQFETNSFTNRNRIKTATGTQWLTIPVLQSGHLCGSISELKIVSESPWRRKHLKSIEQNYKKASAFERRFPLLSNIISGDQTLLADLCYAQLEFWLSELQVDTRIIRASSLNVSGKKSDLILDICTRLGATTYVSGPLGRDYLDEGSFRSAGINLCYHEYAHPVYQQLHGEFIPNLAVVDYWLNGGSPNDFRSRGSRP